MTEELHENPVRIVIRARF